MIKIQRNSILQTGNKRPNSKTVQIHAPQLMPITKNHIRRRRIRAFTRKPVLLQFVPLETRALELRLHGNAFLRAHAPRLARMRLETMRAVRLQMQPRRAGTEHPFRRIVAIMGTQQAEAAQLLGTAQSFVRAVLTIGAVVAQLIRGDALGVVVAHPRWVLAVRIGKDRVDADVVDELLVAVALV